jgi:hypothetical protein
VKKWWDVFISYASEERETVALPLARTLSGAGLNVWFDQFELRVGDSLRQKIDEGLSSSTFGVVIISKHFLDKAWPQKELNGLFALEDTGGKTILPVWHEVDKTAVAQRSPILADRVALNTNDGINKVVQAIAHEVLERSATRPRELTLSGQFVDILSEGPLPGKVSEFLTIYPNVVGHMVGHSGYSIWSDFMFRVQSDLGGFKPDLSVGDILGTSGEWKWRHFLFCPAEGLYFTGSRPTGVLKEAIEKIDHFQGWLTDNEPQARKDLGVPEWGSHEGIIVVGRRDRFSQSDRQSIRSFRNRGIHIRSYDWLIDACVRVDPSRSAERRALDHG